MKRNIGIMIAAWLLAVTHSIAASAIIRYNAGPGPLGADPATQDGYLTQPGNQFWSPLDTDTGAGINDGGTPAWQLITDTDSGSWRITPVTAADIALGNTIGWTLTARLRVPNPGYDVNDNNIEVHYGDGVKYWPMRFGSENDGDQVVRLFNGATNPTYTLQGLGGSAYHLYELRYDPTSLTADLFVDGIERLSNWGGSVLAVNGVRWGDLTGSITGVANYNLIQWEAPEPTTTALLGVGGLMLLWRRSAKQK
jgi:hypothetical protein